MTSNKDVPSVKIESITPKRAKMLLATSLRNRKINPGRVTKYATDMKNGNWSPATLLIIDEDGRLVDAHHRLHAVIEANTTVDMVVLTGLDKRFLPYIDTGRPRSAGDMLRFLEQMDGVTSLRNKASIARIVLAAQHGSLANYMVPYDELAAFMLDNIEFVNKAYEKYSMIKPVGGTLAIGAAVFFIQSTNCDKALFNLFIERISKGEEIKSGMPEYAVRNAIFANGRSKNGSVRQSRDLYFLLSAWKDVLNNERRTLYKTLKVVKADDLLSLLSDIGYAI